MQKTSIAPEGWAVIGTVAAVFGVVAIVGTLAGHSWSILPLPVLTGFCLWFFRDPPRRTPDDSRAVVSPADGKVVDVSAVHEDLFLHAPATKISIFMSPLDVHVNRSPVAGRITRLQHTAGKFRAAWEDKASLDNERNAMVLEQGSRRFLVVQIAGFLARRIICRPAVGDALDRGQPYGVIMFGSRVDLYLPPDVPVRVRKGERVVAGVSVLGELPAAAHAEMHA
jgi:phosphatidylserine decarboxylase